MHIYNVLLYVTMCYHICDFSQTNEQILCEFSLGGPLLGL